MVPYNAVRRGILPLIVFTFSFSVAQEQRSDQSTSIQIAENVFVLTGLACNVVAVSGSDDLLLIDNGITGSYLQLKDAIEDLGAGRVKIAVNTHYHFDHVGVNEQLARDGAVLVAHEGARWNMQSEWRIPENTFGITLPVVPIYPESALPSVTFNDSLTIHFGGHEIELQYFPQAHSNTDVIVFVRDINLLHLGDLFMSNGFPVVDSFHGGTIDGMISAVDYAIALIDDRTIIVPGHGPLSDRQELCEYRTMISSARDRIATMIEEGKSLEETVAADPTAGLYSRGKSWLSPQFFVWSVYTDLQRSK